MLWRVLSLCQSLVLCQFVSVCFQCAYPVSVYLSVLPADLDTVAFVTNYLWTETLFSKDHSSPDYVLPMSAFESCPCGCQGPNTQFVRSAVLHIHRNEGHKSRFWHTDPLKWKNVAVFTWTENWDLLEPDRSEHPMFVFPTFLTTLLCNPRSLLLLWLCNFV